MTTMCVSIFYADKLLIDVGRRQTTRINNDISRFWDDWRTIYQNVEISDTAFAVLEIAFTRINDWACLMDIMPTDVCVYMQI